MSKRQTYRRLRRLGRPGRWSSSFGSRVVLALTVMASMLVAGPSEAVPGAVVVMAAPFGLATGYVTTEVTLPRGMTAQLFNPDPLPTPHNVISRKTRRVRVGRRYVRMPLFASVMAGFGGLVPVTGTETLQPGTYRFYCSLHSTNMQGTFTVQ